MSADEILSIVVLILAAFVAISLIVIIVQGAIILHRKISSKWVHCNKFDVWRKIEVEDDSEEREQTEE